MLPALKLEELGRLATLAPVLVGLVIARLLLLLAYCMVLLHLLLGVSRWRVWLGKRLHVGTHVDFLYTLAFRWLQIFIWLFKQARCPIRLAR